MKTGISRLKTTKIYRGGKELILVFFISKTHHCEFKTDTVIEFYGQWYCFIQTLKYKHLPYFEGLLEEQLPNSFKFFSLFKFTINDIVTLVWRNWRQYSVLNVFYTFYHTLDNYN